MATVTLIGSATDTVSDSSVSATISGLAESITTGHIVLVASINDNNALTETAVSDTDSLTWQIDDSVSQSGSVSVYLFSAPVSATIANSHVFTVDNGDAATRKGLLVYHVAGISGEVSENGRNTNASATSLSATLDATAEHRTLVFAAGSAVTDGSVAWTPGGEDGDALDIGSNRAAVTSWSHEIAPGTHSEGGTLGEAGAYAMVVAAYNLAGPRRTGTASEVDASAGDGSTSVTVPAEANLVVATWQFWDGGGNSITSLTLDGDPFVELGSLGVFGDRPGVGIAILESPSTGSQTLAWDWADGGPDEGGGIYLVYVKDAYIGDPVRDFGLDQQVDNDDASVTLDTEETDLILVNSSCYVWNPPIGLGTLFLDDENINDYVTDLSEFVAEAGSTVVDMAGESYAGLMAVSLQVEPAPPGPTPPELLTPFSYALLSLNPDIYLPLWEASGEPEDFSGNDNHVNTVSGNPTYQSSGPFGGGTYGYGMDFDGTGDGLLVPDHASMDWGDQFSIGCFFRRASTSDEGTYSLVNRGSGAGQIYISGSVIGLARHNITGITSGVDVNDTDWHFILATKDGDDVFLYLDAVDVAGSITSTVCASPTDSLAVARAPGGGETFPGEISAVFGMGGALTQGQAEALNSAAMEQLAQVGAAFPTTGILDPFDESDEDPISTNWDGPIWPSEGQLRLVSNALQQTSGGGDAGSYYDDDAFESDTGQEVYATVVSGPPNPDNRIGVVGRLQDPNTSNFDDITLFLWNEAGTPLLRLYEYEDTSGTHLSPDFLIPYADGNSIGMRITGSLVEVFHNPGTGWRYVGSRTSSLDPVYSYLGVIAGGDNTMILDDFGGGQYVFAQIVRPTADVTTDNWTPTPLFSEINDESDASFISASTT